MKHLNDYFGIASEQKRIFSNKKVSALVAKARNIIQRPQVDNFPFSSLRTDGKA